MSHDCLIIGGGLSGLVCGIKCVKEGLRTVVISGGMNSLHFSSGSIDLMSYDSSGAIVPKPFIYLKKFIAQNPDHPYARIGMKTIREAMDFFKEEMLTEGLNLYDNGEENHFHITGLGTLKASYFSQESVFNEKLKKAYEEKSSIAVLNFDGFRDYFPELTLEQLKNLHIFKDIKITTANIKLPYYFKTERNLHEFRSVDLARVFDTERYLPRIANEIKQAAGDASIVSLPAFMGIENSRAIHRRLEEMTGLLIYEVPTLPPSILGMRLDRALRSRFAALGGELSFGDRVTGGEIIKGKVDHVHTENYGTTRHRAGYYVLSTGSFFSGGLKSDSKSIDEPIFKLNVNKIPGRNRWYEDSFFSKKSHPFLSYGVETSKTLHPSGPDNKEVKNLYSTGAILSGYNPVSEGCGGGVAISTGYYAALRIIKDIKRSRA